MNWLRTAVYQLVTVFFVSSHLFGNIQALNDSRDATNNRILFLTNAERGQANVFLATSQALLKNYPSADIQFASFPPLAGAVAAISEGAIGSGSSRSITFHSLKGPTYLRKLADQGYQVQDLAHPPGLIGASVRLGIIPSLFIPWTGPEFVEIYDDVVRVIESIRPGLVVVDSFFTPGHDAARQLQLNHVVLSPNSIRDFITIDQPRGEAFWKFPITASGFPYPLPWHLIPSNLLVWARLLSLMLPSCYFGRIHELTAYRKSHGIDNPVHPLQSLTQGSSILIASAPEIEYPMVMPSSIVPCGPILPEPGSLDAGDPALASWLASAPTVVINLGSHVQYDREKAINFARTVVQLLAQTDVQILWKFNRKGIDYSTDFLSSLDTEIAGSRLRMVDWIPGDISALFNSGQVACFVHHGGANSFHEAVAAGVPQVVLPLWVDTYDYARQTEWLGVGVWGNKQHAPFVNAEELSDSIFHVLADHGEGKSIRRKASEIAASFSRPGRDVAAEHVVRALRSGDQTMSTGQGTLKDEL